MNGLIVLLNGTSSSGKTAIAEELLKFSEYGFHHLSIDYFFTDFLMGMRDGYPGLKVLTPGQESLVRNNMSPLLFKVFYRIADCHSRVGRNVVLDTVADVNAIAEHMHMYDEDRVLCVAVECPVEELERRERERGDRMIGLARKQSDRIHRDFEYDLRVDSSQHTPAQMAKMIIDSIDSRGSFARMKGPTTGASQ